MGEDKGHLRLVVESHFVQHLLVITDGAGVVVVIRSYRSLLLILLPLAVLIFCGLDTSCVIHDGTHPVALVAETSCLCTAAFGLRLLLTRRRDLPAVIALIVS